MYIIFFEKCCLFLSELKWSQEIGYVTLPMGCEITCLYWWTDPIDRGFTDNPCKSLLVCRRKDLCNVHINELGLIRRYLPSYEKWMADIRLYRWICRVFLSVTLRHCLFGCLIIFSSVWNRNMEWVLVER